MSFCDVIIIGAGAAGLMAAIEAGKRGRTVLVLDHALKIGEKIRISGGGRCNFTNIHCAPDRFVSQNRHFCKSALARYTPQDFTGLVKRHGITWHEKTLGQLFCDGSAQQIIDMLVSECGAAGVIIKTGVAVKDVARTENGFRLEAGQGIYECRSLVIATGGPSIPKIGASGFAYDIARQFGINVIDPQPALVPLTFTDDILILARDLSGVSVDPAVIVSGRARFREALLFTHRGLSGPAVLQISSYWRLGEDIIIDLAPDIDVLTFLKDARQSRPKKKLHNVLGEILPQRLADVLAGPEGEKNMADLPDTVLGPMASRIKHWQVRPNGTEGYRTAEVTRGGIDTDELSSQTFESKRVPGLYFIGECVDVTGWLGGYNFQWAWSSGWCAGQVI